jgi:hypothetical protein
MVSSAETVDSIIRKISEAIKADSFLIDEIECDDNAPGPQVKEAQPKPKQRGPLVQSY